MNARTRCLGWLLLPAFLATFGASDPDVARVRVPAAQVSAWFPVGFDLEVLTSDQFEELVRAARDRGQPSPPPRILRARHTARLESGVLVGRTELTIEPSTGQGSRLVILEPWSPSLVVGDEGTKLFRATSDGRLAAKVEPSAPRSIEAVWQLQGRPGSEGRAFALALPDVDLASLVLDLPTGWTPEAKSCPRVGPEPSATPDRAIWRFEAARGVIDLRLRNPADDVGKSGGPGLWLEGTTRIDLKQRPINWRADWTLDESPGAPRRLTVELDPGLELVDVVGPRVASFREESAGQSSRVTIQLDGEGSGPSPLTIRAICRAPAEGLWEIPSARPLDATWIGGRTFVTLDPSRVLQACAERSGRRVPPRPTDPASSPSLIFEAKAEVGPVAELTLRKPTADATIDIRGHLLLGDEAPRIEVALTWTVERGRLLTHAVDLSPGWTPDQVLSSVKQPVPWHADPLSNGGTRVQIGPALADENDLILTLTLSATARKAGVTGPLDLPRVRPSPGVRIVDEVWAATPAPGLGLRPILGRGLAWIDPLDPPLDDAPAPWGADDLINALAWRWLADDAEGRINRTWPLDRPRADARLDASIVDGRLGLTWTLALESDLGDLRSIPIHLDSTVEPPIRWRSRTPAGPVVETKPIDDARRAKLGFPATGSAWDLELSGATRGRIELEATLDQPWTGRGRIPILSLPERFRSRGVVTVSVAETTRIAVEATGLTPIDPTGLASSETKRPIDSNRAPATRRAALFAYRSTGGRLSVTTTEGGDPAPRGVIREAFLLSQVFPGEGIRHRLSLKLAGASGRSVTFRLPAGATLDRIRRDGQPVVVGEQPGSSFRVDLLDGAGSRLDPSLTFDYRTETDARSGPIDPSSLLPDCSLPCLSFTWEVVAPEPWVVGPEVVGLVDTDPRPIRSATARVLGFRLDPWSRPDGGKSEVSSAVILTELDRTAAEAFDGEATLGDWLVKLDAGRWPIVVDRLALRSGGWGPTSRLGSPSTESRLLGPVKGVLQPMGLTATPMGGSILITSRLEDPQGPADRSAWTSAVRGVAAVGSDPTDRFQSPARWRGEATPRALAAGESLDRPTGPGGWHCRRLVSVGWPPTGASIRLIDERADRAWGWAWASLIVVGGILARNRPARLRAVGLISFGLAASVALAWNWPEPPGWAAGWCRGALAVTAFWAGRAFRSNSIPAPSRPNEGSTTSRRSGFLAVVGGSGLLVVITSAAAQQDLAGRILALLVFDGAPDATSKPDRVVLSLADASRLRALARPAPAHRASLASLSAASHRVTRDRARLASVESLYEVDIEPQGGDESVVWSMPVGLAHDLSATVDGRAVPLRISADGRSAVVNIEKAGRHAIAFRRSLSLQDFGPEGGSRISLPINRAAFARISVVKGTDPQWVQVPSAAGKLEVGTAGIEGGLGPHGNLEVQWFPEDRRPFSGIVGPVEATFLWDARPVGDLIRLRLAHADPDGASTIRLALEPGLIVRRHAIANVVSIRQEGTPERPEWVARMDPPLPKDSPIEVDLWRTATPGLAGRNWPTIAIAATGKVNQLLGFRRPSDWSGRLELIPGIETVSEVNFVKVWGPLDDTGLTLAGAVRFNAPPRLAVSIQPLVNLRSIRSNVKADLALGRLNVAIEATLSDEQGRSFDLEVGLPNDLRLIRVEAVGLVDWQKLARDRLRLQFDGSEVVERRVRIEGYLPVPSDSTMTEARSYQARVPWPRWFVPEPLPGSLVVTGPTRFQVDLGKGIVALPTTTPPESDVAFRSSFRVDRPDGLSTIRWSAPPSRFFFSVASDLTIDPLTLHWTAVVIHDIQGGPADRLYWDLPTEWAREATLEIEGQPHRLVVDSKGAQGEITHWTILPESPLWGRTRLTLRSKRPIEPGKLFAYPEITPLAATGRGQVERYEVAIANVSGRDVRVDRTQGLQSVEVARVRSDESPVPPGSVVHAYRVTGGKWSLRLRVGQTGEAPVISGDARPSKVALATIAATLGPDGAVWGRAHYDLEPNSGPFLAFRLPESNQVPWTMVDGRVEPVIADGPGRWLIPLGDRQARRVSVLWHRPGSSLQAAPAPGTSLDLPELSTSQPPTLVSMDAPPDVALNPLADAFEPVAAPLWEVELIERRAALVVDDLLNLDRTLTRDQERVVDDLVDLELRARIFLRQPATEPGVVRVRAALASIEEVCVNAGLEDLFQQAQARVGLATGFEDPARTPRSNPATTVRLRKIGVSWYFRSKGDASARPLAFSTGRIAARTDSTVLERGGIVGVGFLISAAGGWWVARPRSRPRRRLVVLAILLAGLGLAWEPLGMAAVLALARLGRKLA